MKHNISITMDQKLFRQIEIIRGREKRSSFIEHLITLGLKEITRQDKKLISPQAKVNVLPIGLIHLKEQETD